MEDTLTQALHGACANLNRTGVDLGAICAAVLLNTGQGAEIVHFWSGAGDQTASSVDNRFLLRADGPNGAIDSESASAKLLRETLGPRSQSFLVHRWQANRQAVALVVGFADPEPPLRRFPDTVEASLNMVAFAFWSTNEIARLRTELKDADRRLSVRKLVERAKGVLQLERGLSEESAYAYLRGQSRRRRVTLGRIAEEVVRVNGGFDRSQIS